MNTVPEAPGSWRLTPAEIERLANDAVGEPATGENSWRPEGGSLVAGIGQCLYDEIKSIWDLVVLLKQLNDDIDLAADGVDNWEIWRSQVGDVRDVGVLMYELSQGREDFGALPRQQQIGLFKVYAKITAVKKILGEMGRAGLNMIAAYDVYWNTEYEVFTFNQSENILKALADAVSIFYTDAEWASLAEGGRDLANRVTQLVKERFEQDPWGSSGYVACLVALFFSPSKILRALRPLLSAFGSLNRSATLADMARVLRTHNIEVPPWLGGNKTDLPEVPPAAGKVDDAADARPVTPDAEPQLSRDDPDPERAEKPTERETPPITPNTTRIPRLSDGKRPHPAGDIAEMQARSDLIMEHPGAEVIDLKYGANSGVDNLVIYRDENGNITRLINVETKSRLDTSNADPINLTGPQAGGPVKHLQTTLANMPRSKLKKELEEFIKYNESQVTGELRAYRVEPETGKVTERVKHAWIENRKTYKFDIDTGFNGGQVDPVEALERSLRRLKPATLEAWYTEFPELRGMFTGQGQNLRRVQ